jgi:hypothetical protein
MAKARPKIKAMQEPPSEIDLDAAVAAIICDVLDLPTPHPTASQVADVIDEWRSAVQHGDILAGAADVAVALAAAVNTTDGLKQNRWAHRAVQHMRAIAEGKGPERVDAMRDCVQHLRAGVHDEGRTAPAATVYPLSVPERAVLAIIKALPPGTGITGPKILEKLAQQQPAIYLEQSTLTSQIIPVLKKHHGVLNRQNVGYYVAATPGPAAAR